MPLSSGLQIDYTVNIESLYLLVYLIFLYALTLFFASLTYYRYIKSASNYQYILTPLSFAILALVYIALVMLFIVFTIPLLTEVFLFISFLALVSFEWRQAKYRRCKIFERKEIDINGDKIKVHLLR